jgi:cytidylate kinase
LDGHRRIKLIVSRLNLCKRRRARRRHLELQKRGDSISYDEVLADILRRDERDSARSSAPLIKAGDACLLDTTNLGIEEAFWAALDQVERAVSASASRQG